MTRNKSRTGGIPLTYTSEFGQVNTSGLFLVCNQLKYEAKV